MANTYKVLSQVQDTEINAAGTGFENVWKITVRVTSGPAAGATPTIVVPEEHHNADDVGKAIAAKVAQLSDVASLGK